MQSFIERIMFDIKDKKYFSVMVVDKRLLHYYES